MVVRTASGCTRTAPYLKLSGLTVVPNNPNLKVIPICYWGQLDAASEKSLEAARNPIHNNSLVDVSGAPWPARGTLRERWKQTIAEPILVG